MVLVWRALRASWGWCFRLGFCRASFCCTRMVCVCFSFEVCLVVREGERICLKELRLGRDELSRKQTLLMNRTLYYAQKSKCHQQHGAIVVKSGRVVGFSCNKRINNPAQFCNDLFNEHREYISLHAEVAALRNVSPELAKGSTVYIGRLLKNGEPGFSRPCSRCEEFLNELGVKRVVYT